MNFLRKYRFVAYFLLIVSILVFGTKKLFACYENMDNSERPKGCFCTAMSCIDSPCNTCVCDDGEAYKSW
jgi:hypothetical protein